ncbi:MAG: RNA polymerase sigma factor [Myxococcota bacterium]
MKTVTEETARLIDRAQKGDAAALRALFERYRPLVVRLLEGFATLDQDDMEDVVQETFTRAFRALPRLKAAAAFESWLLCIARNRALSHLAKSASSRRTQALLQAEEVAAIGLLPPAFHAEVDARVVRELVEALPEGAEKETVRLFYLEGRLSAREIAERLGVGKSAVTMRLERFRARAKRELLVRLTKARWE